MNVAFWLSLISLTLSLAICLFLAIRWYKPQPLASKWRWCVTSLMLLISLPFCYDQFLHCTDVTYPLLYRIVVNGGFLLLALTIPLLVGFADHLPSFSSRWRPSASVAFLAIMQLGWSVYLVRRLSDPEQRTPIGTVVPGDLLLDTHACGITDLGHKISLFHWDLNQNGYADYQRWSREYLSGFIRTVIQRADPSPLTNCHGWVFTEGQFVMTGNQIDEILHDNGYVRTDNPQANDIVVYRSNFGVVLHTGLVRGVLNDGTIMIESKWGFEGRYLHPVEDQPYSDNVFYWRTQRPSHALRVEWDEQDS